MPRITVVISTDGKRYDKLRACLRSIRLCRYAHYSVLVLIQSDHPVPLPSWVRAVEIPKYGTSFSKNVALSLCDSEIIAFTDDDCLVDPRWLSGIAAAFKDSQVTGVYGRVIPYEPHRRFGERCPSYMLRSKKERIRRFTPGQTHFGIGCNMAFRVNTLRDIGGFAEWLGPGRFGKAAEDVELLFRLLMEKRTLVYDPKIMVFHDRWLSTRAYRAVYFGYHRGLLAAYSFHMVLGHPYGKAVVKTYWNALFRTMRQSWIALFRQPIPAAITLVYDAGDLFHYLQGSILGWWHARNGVVDWYRRAIAIYETANK